MTTEKKFSGGCLNCNYETTDRAELKAHNCTETMESTWEKFQKQLQEATLCGACGKYYEEDEQGDDSYHSAKLCDANNEIGE